MARALKSRTPNTGCECKVLAQLAIQRAEGPAPGRIAPETSYMRRRSLRRRFILLRARLFVGCAVFCTLALVATLAGGGVVPDQGGKDSKPARAEFTVASTSASSSAAGGANAATTESAVSSVVVPSRALPFGPVPPSLTLVVVGTMLIGLAAAVRRTT